MEQCTQDVAQLIEQQSLAPVNLLGYSMGGRLALYLAATRPELVTTLILESASPGLELEEERRTRVRHDEELANEIERDGVEAFVNYWEGIPLFASQASLAKEARQALREQRLENRALALANSLRGMGAGAQPSMWERLPLLEKPTLVMTGELDEKYVKLGERMTKEIPAALQEVVEGAGHTIHLEQPEKFEELVRFFLHLVAYFS
jgi:2-succinyl-6-hydroxy-2,4-cyclohexadiene-1-carboxylate synthase